MTIQGIEKSALFLFICKNNFLNSIRPADKGAKAQDGYQKLVDISKVYFDANQIDAFTSYFQEHQYCVNLWTAHLILEYGNPNSKLAKECLDIIKRYTDTPFDQTLAHEEKEWLENYHSTR
jgi:hypothetical protein